MTSPEHLFPDNTVLINFAIIEQVPLLEKLLAGKGKWVAAVAAECELSIRTGLYPAELASVSGMMTETLIPSRSEAIDARTIRNEIAAPYEPFPKSYGEAQTLAIITKRDLSAIVITDDGGVGRYVAENEIEVIVVSTTDILAMAVRANLMTQPEGEAHIAKLIAAGRHRISLKRFRASLAPRPPAV